ncbi:MAG TPA: DUF4395 family protein [Actinomycetota bacterium]|nr:DUF4395 family protein [Actinomycetota bacterium]
MQIVQKLAAGRTAHPYRDIDVIDVRAPRFNQGVVALMCVLALITGSWWFASVMGLQLAIGLLFGRQFCVTCLFYFEVLQPRFGEGPIEDARPPRFANILGAIFLLSATTLHLAGLATAGWVLIGVVAALATLAVTTGFCMGCTMYRVIARFRGVRPGHHDHIDMRDFDVTSDAVIQFTHPLCSDCKEMERELRAKEGDLVVVDVSKQKDLARKYHVDVVPLALRVSSEGRVLQRLA